MTKPEPTTYALIGYDNEDMGDYKARGDCVIIRYDDPRYNTFAAASAAIKTPANVILQAHGGKDGSFSWTKDDQEGKSDGPYYTDLLRNLPSSGIASVTLGSCYGGSVEADAILAAAPPGTIILSMTGSETPATSGMTKRFAAETKGFTRPMDFFIKALDNFNLKAYWDEVSPHREMDANPDHALPHIIGIGGQPPQRIDLQTECHALNATANDPAFARALAHVQERFDTNSARVPASERGKDDISRYIEGSLGENAEKALHAHIASVADKLSHGWIPLDEKTKGRPLTFAETEEKRIAYAITAAYLDESGELDRRVEQAKEKSSAQMHFDADGKPISGLQKAATFITHPQQILQPVLGHALPQDKNLSQNEMAYLNSVGLKLDVVHPDQTKSVKVADISLLPSGELILPDGGWTNAGRGTV